MRVCERALAGLITAILHVHVHVNGAEGAAPDGPTTDYARRTRLPRAFDPLVPGRQQVARSVRVHDSDHDIHNRSRLPFRAA
jgi:hypothetical protein